MTRKQLTGRQRVGIIGWPVAHSVSPAMHNAAFEALGMKWRYELWPTPADAIEDRVAQLRTAEFAGANVTIPHKQAVIPLLDEVMDAAAVVGAVNTIVAVNDTLIGYNTDVAGIGWALEQNRVAPVGWHTVVLGAGGAARAALYALHASDAASITVFNRTPERAADLVSELQPHLPGVELTSASLSEVSRLDGVLARADLLINATSVGMHPNVEESPFLVEVELPDHIVVFDMVYNPQQTRLLRQANIMGARTIGGLDMLVGQGAEAFKLWTGRTPPVDLMHQAALGALETE